MKLRVASDPDKPTPIQIEQANQFARNFAMRRGLVSGQNTYVGNQLPQFVSAMSGKPQTAVFPRGTIMNISQIPSYVKNLEINHENNLPYFIDPTTDEIRYVHPDIFFSSRFNPNRGKSADVLMSLAKK